MKKIFLMCVATIGLGVLSTAGVAHEGDAAGKGAETPAGHDEMGPRMGKWLDLKPDQIEKFKSAMKTHHAEMKPLFEAERDALKTLREQVKAKADDGAVQATLTKLRAAQKEVAESETKFHDSLSFLTATQRAKLLLAHAMMMHRGPMGHGMGPDGMRRHQAEVEGGKETKPKGAAAEEDGDDD